eukprot:TRINITY_DN56120_c0_g1_i4.p1 TRINITY_DN56120_c0_g1~~TRINITY_DN56120_c0_g1_i4.p1  ORF type:complete len:328 (+),score=39.10 TRINITY_DN56120_c0_g1_i4:17-1000(+)
MGLFFFKQKTAYEIGLGIPAEPLFRSGHLPKTSPRGAGCSQATAPGSERCMAPRQRMDIFPAATGAELGAAWGFFFSSRRRHTRSVSAFLLNRSSDLGHLPKTSPRGAGCSQATAPGSERCMAPRQRMDIFPAATGAELGAAWGAPPSGSIVTARVAPSTSNWRCCADRGTAVLPARGIRPSDMGAPPSGITQSSGESAVSLIPTMCRRIATVCGSYRARTSGPLVMLPNWAIAIGAATGTGTSPVRITITAASAAATAPLSNAPARQRESCICNLATGSAIRAARSEERFSRNAETDLVCRLLLEKKKPHAAPSSAPVAAGKISIL